MSRNSKLLDVANLRQLNRGQLQALAKRENIRANLTNDSIIRCLIHRYPKGVPSCILVISHLPNTTMNVIANSSVEDGQCKSADFQKPCVSPHHLQNNIVNVTLRKRRADYPSEALHAKRRKTGQDSTTISTLSSPPVSLKALNFESHQYQLPPEALRIKLPAPKLTDAQMECLRIQRDKLRAKIHAERAATMLAIQKWRVDVANAVDAARSEPSTSDRDPGRVDDHQEDPIGPCSQGILPSSNHMHGEFSPSPIKDGHCFRGLLGEPVFSRPHPS